MWNAWHGISQRTIPVIYFCSVQFSSVQFSRSVLSDSLRSHELQHARPPCPSPSPGIYSNLCPSSRWCHPAISSSVVPFSSCPQSLPASESFPMSQLFAWLGQSTGVSVSASVLPKNTQGWSPLEWTGWISLLSKGLSRVFSNTTVQKHQFFGAQHGKIHPCLASSQIPFVSFFDFIIFKMKTFDTFFFPPQNVRPHSNQKIDFLKAFAESHTPTIIKRCTQRTVWGCGEEKLSK